MYTCTYIISKGCASVMCSSFNVEAVVHRVMVHAYAVFAYSLLWLDIANVEAVYVLLYGWILP